MDLSAIIIEVAGLITACSTIVVFVNKGLKKTLQPLENKIETLDLNQCKNFLTDSFSDIRAGIPKSNVQMARIYEVYDHYTQKGGNSYIHEEFEALKKEGKL